MIRLLSTAGSNGLMAATLWIAIAACGTSSALTSPAPRQSRVKAGAWGGEHVLLTVTESGARVEFDCAHGAVDGALSLDANGQFDARGTYVREVGPSRQDDAGDPARYAGRVSGDAMTLRVSLLGNPEQPLGDYSLAFEKSARLRKCQ